MDDGLFLAKLNQISKEHHLKIPLLTSDEPPTSEEITNWASFVESCVKRGVSMGDPRWKRVTIESRVPHTTFSLEGGCEEPPDRDFRVGLQLFLGILERDEELTEQDNGI
jgi:hypothetical protein